MNSYSRIKRWCFSRILIKHFFYDLIFHKFLSGVETIYEKVWGDLYIHVYLYISFMTIKRNVVASGHRNRKCSIHEWTIHEVFRPWLEYEGRLVDVDEIIILAHCTNHARLLMITQISRSFETCLDFQRKSIEPNTRCLISKHHVASLISSRLEYKNRGELSALSFLFVFPITMIMIYSLLNFYTVDTTPFLTLHFYFISVYYYLHALLFLCSFLIFYLFVLKVVKSLKSLAVTTDTVNKS